MLKLLRVGISGLLCMVFSVPLAIIAKSRDIRDEPIVVLVLNMLATALLFSSSLAIVSVSDLLTEVHPLLCSVLISLGAGALSGFKLSALFLAVEQFVAVVFPLRSFALISRHLKAMVALTWLLLVGNATFGTVCYLLGLETVAEFNRRVFGINNHAKQCQWDTQTNIFMLYFEICMLLLYISTSILLIYAAVQGLKHERRISRENNNDNEQQFLIRFKSFKRIVKVLLVVVFIDIIGACFRFGSRWFVQSPLFTIIHYLRILFIIIECWTYGFSHMTTRKAIRSFFGFHENQVHPEQRREHELPARQSQAVPDEEPGEELH